MCHTGAISLMRPVMLLPNSRAPPLSPLETGTDCTDDYRAKTIHSARIHSLGPVSLLDSAYIRSRSSPQYPGP